MLLNLVSLSASVFDVSKARVTRHELKVRIGTKKYRLYSKVSTI